MSDTPPTELVADKYRLTRLLGRGGMGTVWEGVHTSLNTRVAVKFIETEHADSAEARARFQNEARAAAKLASKHVVKVFDHGVTPDGRPYMVMEFLAGEPLDQRLDRVGRLTLQETTSIVQQVAKALTRAHDAGIVHRDLKPENVFLVREEDEANEIVKVVDFGIAKFTDASTSGLSSSTKTGHVLGTPYYMSPEQARGLRAVDHRSDLWSIAVIAFKAVTGQMPFTGEAVGDLLVQICTAPAPRASETMPGVPPGFDAWVGRALAKEPAQRFQTATELADGLASIAGLPTSAPSPISNAATVAGPSRPSHPAWPRPAEGVTASPFTHNAIPKKSTPVGVLVGAGVGGVLLLGVMVAVVVSLGSKSSTAGTAPEAVPATAATPVVETKPTVAATVQPPPSASVEAPAPSASIVVAPKEVKSGTKTGQKTGTKTGTKSGTPTTAGTKKPVDPLGY